MMVWTKLDTTTLKSGKDVPKGSLCSLLSLSYIAFTVFFVANLCALSKYSVEEEEACCAAPH